MKARSFLGLMYKKPKALKRFAYTYSVARRCAKPM